MLEINDFSSIRISLASPEAIKGWSHGEVTKPETINYRTLKPERDGLFCEKIFGPTRDWECYCGKYKRVRFKGVVCDKCGVEVVRSKIRRERMAHIQLATPVSHIWFVKGSPSRLSLLLDITPRNLERVLYFAAYIVTHIDEEARGDMRAEIEARYNDRIKALEVDADSKRGQIATALSTNLQQRNSKEETPKVTIEPARKQADIDAQFRVLKLEYETLKEELRNREDEIVEDEILFHGQVLIEEGRKITEDSLDQLDELYERETVALKKSMDDAETLRADAELIRDAFIEIGEQKDRAIDRLLDEKKQKIDFVDSIKPKRVLSETDYRELREIAPGVFKAEMGAGAIRDLLVRTVNLDDHAETLQNNINAAHSTPLLRKLSRKLRVVEAFRNSGNKPEWMIMTVLPVIPPDLRPMVQLDGGRFATSDLNDLYRRVINRNNRLKRLMELNAPDIIVRNEKRMLQEAVDALIDNGRRGLAVSGKDTHRLESLTDLLRGKQGRFRKNLLGKRVDYSGRSVIVPGPNLKLHQCGLPKKMALELFKPFVMQRLVANGIVSNIKAAKKLVERVKPEVWDVLEEIIKEYLVLLNRAPSLHRLSIQAFEVNLIEGSAIQLHPLVCTAFNADFDGDQMAVHVPLSRKAQEEARLRMLSKYNILSPATGDPIITPSQDIVLGCFYLTIVNDGGKGAGKIFTSADEALLAFDKGVVDIQAPVWVRMEGVTLQGDNIKTIRSDGSKVPASVRPLPDGNDGSKRMLLETTVGRLIFNRELLPPLQYRNHEVVKDGLKHIIADCYKYYTNPDHLTEADLDTIRAMYPERYFSPEELHRYYGSERTAEQADKIKALGFHYAMRGGMTVGVEDIGVPKEKAEALEKAENERIAADRRYRRGLTTDEERYKEVIDIWTEAGKKMTKLVRELNEVKVDPETKRFNPVSMMVTSKARGNINQLTQMAGMRGLMADPTGKIIELPIKSNFREGLTVLEYFVSTHGGRKGLADTALRTADAVYLTRRLIDVAQDNIVTIEDCGSKESLLLHSSDDTEVMKVLPARVVGRIAAEDILRTDGSVLVPAGEEIHEDLAREFVKNDIAFVNVRTPLTCQAEFGICRKCYGRNLATGKLVEIGEAVGIIAAQSIGERGTQLTLRTFHTGGVASADDITQGLPRIIEIFEARVQAKTRAVLAEQDGLLTEHKEEGRHTLHIVDDGSVYDEQIMPKHYVAVVENGERVTKNQVIARSNRTDLGGQTIRARQDGVVMVSGSVITVVDSYHEEVDTIVATTARLRKGLNDGTRVYTGQLLTEGAAHPQELLQIQGRDALQSYLVKEAQKVYRSQGVDINDKHLEVIIRQMLRRVRIDETGDTHYLPGETVDQAEFTRVNADVWAQGGMPAVASSLLLGITRASLMTDSFLSAASFQETTRVLTEAAITGKIDYLRGLKENVVIGKLIPAGTGAEARRLVAAAADRETERLRAIEIENARLDAEEEEYYRDSEPEQPQQPAAAVAVEPKRRITRTATLSPEDVAALALLEQLRKEMNTVAKVAQPAANVAVEAPVAKADVLTESQVGDNSPVKATETVPSVDQTPVKPKKAPAKKRSEDKYFDVTPSPQQRLPTNSPSVTKQAHPGQQSAALPNVTDTLLVEYLASHNRESLFDVLIRAEISLLTTHDAELTTIKQLYQIAALRTSHAYQSLKQRYITLKSLNELCELILELPFESLLELDHELAAIKLLRTNKH
jgi:DNA-directed RNA polymerase subunit beta'